MRELLLYAFLFVIIGLTFVSFFLVWQWFDAKDRLKVVREVTREQTLHAIRHSHNKCRILLYLGILLALAYIPVPFLIGGSYYSTLIYPGIAILVDILILIGLLIKAREYRAAIDDYVNENEEHVREAAAQREQQREQWRKEAADLNPKAQAVIKEALGDNYETWYQHDILVGRNVLVNRELGKMYVQGIVIPISEIMEVRQGRKDLKLVTSNSTYPFITIDFGALPINPETGNRYKDEIAQKIEALMA